METAGKGAKGRAGFSSGLIEGVTDEMMGKVRSGWDWGLWGQAEYSWILGCVGENVGSKKQVD